MTLLVGLLVNTLLHAASVEVKNVRIVPKALRLTAVDPVNVVENYASSVRKSNAPDTVRVLALRAQFVPDSLKTTTGEGHFDLSTTGESVIDRPPHNKVYFEHQLLALRNYFYTVSNGRLVLESQVLPEGLSDAYQLPHNMIYYSGEEDEQKQKLRWAELMRDAAAAAYAQNPAAFNRFDAVIVFHAGVGKDFAFDFSETPYDIQSAFIDLETLRETIGNGLPDYAGIELGNGVKVREGIILPEAQSQKGYNLGLLGTAALLMGSQLGMPNLFNTDTGRAGIGKWGLMDQGSYNFYGLIPAHPSAWEKVYMGWEEPVVVHSLEQAVIGAPGTRSAPRIIKVPISLTEYFLLENRQEDLNGDGITFGRDQAGKRMQFNANGELSAEEGLGVITRVYEYDYGLPGSGILIWHIDEQVIRQNLLTNTINNNPEQRGVRLIECDGPQDIGQAYSMFTPGYGTEAGDYWDPYWSDNLSHKYVNGEKPVEFSGSSIPNRDASGGAKTHIRIGNFSDKDSLMTLSIRSDFHRNGFPQLAGGSYDGALTMFTAPDGRPTIAMLASNGDLFAWHGDGSKVVENHERRTVRDGSNKLVDHSFALIGRAGFQVQRPIAAWDLLPNPAGEELLTLDDRGELLVWSVIDADNDGYAEIVARYEIGERPTAGPLVLDAPVGGGSILVGTESGKVFLFSMGEGLQKVAEKYVSGMPITGMVPFNGGFAFAAGGSDISFQSIVSGEFRETRYLSIPGKADVAHLLRLQTAGDGERLAVLDSYGSFWLIDQSGQIVAERLNSSWSHSARTPAFGDVDSDGVGEVIYTHDQKLHAVELNGVPTLNFPYLSEGKNAALGSGSSPLWVQGIDGPITIFSDGNLIHALDGAGQSMAAFPIGASGRLVRAIMLWVNDDQTLTIFAESDGFLHAWDTGIKVKKEGIWPRYGGDARSSFSHQPAFQSVALPKDVMPDKLVFCYPNPSADGRTFIRYTLHQPVSDVNIRIYDIAGSLVTEFAGNAVHPGDHEVMWDVTPVQSGAYIARVEARHTGGSLVKFLKIAVVK